MLSSLGFADDLLEALGLNLANDSTNVYLDSAGVEPVTGNGQSLATCCVSLIGADAVDDWHCLCLVACLAIIRAMNDFALYL